MKITKTLVTGLTAAALITTLGTATAFAREGRHGPPRIVFADVDANADGQITPEELEAHRASRFEAQDADGNGTLSKEEIVASVLGHAEERMQKRTDRMFERKDANGDGQLSMAELSDGDRADKFFERADADGNGSISQEELGALEKHRKGDHKRRAPSE